MTKKRDKCFQGFQLRKEKEEEGEKGMANKLFDKKNLMVDSFVYLFKCIALSSKGLDLKLKIILKFKNKYICLYKDSVPIFFLNV